jgi:hypothetical protein
VGIRPVILGEEEFSGGFFAKEDGERIILILGFVSEFDGNEFGLLNEVCESVDGLLSHVDLLIC